ncbi:MAG TPA: hypothetical protein VEQ85_07490 [Lacipirellulaceae bacterium]|nr:hypothetical protein [Lacipirellulaceae bacterium]
MGTAAAIAILTLHLLAMNVASAGPLAAAWMLGATWGDAAALAHARRMIGWSLGGLALGAVLGGALWLPTNEGLRAALARFPASTYWFAGAELLFSLLCLAAMHRFAPRLQHRPWLAWFVAIVPASNLLYHFPPLMAVIGRLAADPRWTTAELIDRRTLLGLWARPEVLALWAHYTLASLAVACVAGMWPGEAARAPEESPRPAGTEGRLTRGLAHGALGATALQLPVGGWLLAATPPQARDMLLGGSILASATFLAGIGLSLALLHTLAAAAMGDGALAVRRRAVLLMVAVAATMTGTLLLSREEQAPPVEQPLPQGEARQPLAGSPRGAIPG